jgi:hypothetical protein
MNSMVHNTAWIMGHFHVTLGTTVALTFMGATYWLLPRIAGRELRFKHWGDPVTEPEVRGADDTRRHPRLAVSATRAHGRNALHELRLADHFELFRSVGTVHRRALDEHGLAHVMRPDILDKILKEVPVAGSIPQVVMGVDDRKPWLERGLVGQRQPVRGLDGTTGRLLGPRARRPEAFQGACSGETTERVLPCTIEKAPARDLIHTLNLPCRASAGPQILIRGESWAPGRL